VSAAEPGAAIDRALDAARPTSAPPPGTALEAELRAMRPTPPRSPPRQLAAMALLLGATAAAGVGLTGLRRDVHELPATYVALGAVAWALLALGLGAAAIVPARGQALPRVRLAAALTGGAAIAVVALGVLVHPRGAHSVSLGDDLLAGHACAEVGLGLAVLPVAGLTWLLRRAIPVGDRALAAAIGAAGGAIGGLVLHLHCAVVDPLHLGVMHGGVVGAAALLSALLIAPTLRPRA
jgi:hypothetical protein